MARLIRRWRRLLAALVPVALILAGCSSASGDTNAATSAEAFGVLTINVELTDDAIQPSAIHIPVGQTVQLVLRNRGTTEHHFIVQGLVPKDLLWLFTPEGPPDSEISDQDPAHAGHNHSFDFVPFRPPSPAGIRLTGKEVHGYAMGSSMDVVVFTATKKGTFTVTCPLHPGVVATMTVS